MIDVGLSINCEYVLVYQGLIEKIVSSYVIYLLTLFYIYWNNKKPFTIYVFAWHIKLIGNKVWSRTSKRNLERQHEEWIQKNVYFL